MGKKRYHIECDKRFLKELQNIPLKFRENIVEAIEKLSLDPRPHGYIKLKGFEQCD